MKTSIVALSLVALTASYAAANEGADTSPDWANKSGGVGVGGNTSLGGSNGINVRTYVTPQLGLHVTFGFNIRSVDGEDEEESTTAFDVGLAASYKLAYWQRGHLSAFAGLDVQHLSDSYQPPAPSPEIDASATDLLISLGIMGEYFPTQYLSLFIAAGLRIDFIGEDELDGSDINSEMGRSGFSIDLGSQLAGAAGFTVWFK